MEESNEGIKVVMAAFGAGSNPKASAVVQW